MKPVCVILLNYGTPDLTIASARSVLPEIEALGGELILVDNASPDNSATLLAQWIDTLSDTAPARLIRSPVNGGYAAGNNIGIKAGQQAGGAEFFVLLNSDTLARPGAIGALMAAMRADPKCGVAGPQLLGPDGAPIISRFRFPSPIGEFVEATGANIFYKALRAHVVPIADDEDDSAIDWIGFPCIMLRAAMINEIGLLDENYFMYFEDSAYCRRATKAGWRLAHCREAVVQHFCGKSSMIEDAAAAHRRLPAYYYASRTRFFTELYGRCGFITANLWWYLGRAVNYARPLAMKPPKKTCAGRALDIWTPAHAPPPATRSPH